MLGNHLNALALLKQAASLVSSPPRPEPRDATAPPKLHLDASDYETLRSHLTTLASRMHARVELQSMETNSALTAAKHLASDVPWIQRLHEFPAPGTKVDLANLVAFPPKIEPVPVKPLFLDVAFNYIEYPGRQAPALVQSTDPEVGGGDEGEAAPAQKKGWFGFGR